MAFVCTASFFIRNRWGGLGKGGGGGGEGGGGVKRTSGTLASVSPEQTTECRFYACSIRCQKDGL